MSLFPYEWKPPKPLGRRKFRGCSPAIRIEIFIDEQIISWKRGVPIRMGKGADVIPNKKNESSQTIVRNAWRNWYETHPEVQKFFPWVGPVRATLYFLLPCPKYLKDPDSQEKDSWPDIDNLQKQIKDSLNDKKGGLLKKHGIVGLYKDDGQIVDTYADKRFYPTDYFEDTGRAGLYMPLTLMVMHLYKNHKK